MSNNPLSNSVPGPGIQVPKLAKPTPPKDLEEIIKGMGIGCSYHPYECSHDRYCEHCTNAVTAWHDPTKCWLCCDGDPADNKPRQFVDEPFAIEIHVRDYSHRKLKVKVRLPQRDGMSLQMQMEGI